MFLLVLVYNRVHYYTDTRQHAEKIAKAVTIEYGESQGPILVNTEDAMKANSFFDGIEKTVTCGDVKSTHLLAHEGLWV